MASTMRDKMKQRLGALMRNAKISDSDPEAGSLMDVLLKRIITKRDYEDTFETPERCEKFAAEHSISVRQKDIMLEMQVRRGARAREGGGDARARRALPARARNRT